MYKNGLALSGGGSKGLAHVGVLKFFEEKGIEFQCLAGTSVGSIVSALYVIGFSATDMLNFFIDTKIFSTNHMVLSNKGFVNTSSLRKVFEKHFGNPNIEDFDQKLSIVATDLTNGKMKVFENGNLIDAILASSAYPGVFIPMTIDGIIYSDGGLVNNYPIEIIKEQVKTSVGINLSFVKKVENEELDNIMDILNRSYEIMRKSSEIKLKTNADIYLHPLEENIGIFDTKKDILTNTYNIGYNYANNFFEKNPRMLDDLF
jgi:NTE family protein